MLTGAGRSLVLAEHFGSLPAASLCLCDALTLTPSPGPSPGPSPSPSPTPTPTSSPSPNPKQAQLAEGEEILLKCNALCAGDGPVLTQLYDASGMPGQP